MRNLIFAGLIAVTAPATACGGTTDNNTPTENNQANNTQGTQTVRGMLTADASGEGSVESKTIAASRVDANGNVEAIAGATTQTDAEGHYALALDSTLDEGATVLIEATEDDELLGSVSFDASGEGQTEVNAPPITVESTTESRVMIQARAQGETCGGCTMADVEDRIDSRLAAVVEANADAEPDVHANLANSIYAGIDAFQTALTHESVGVTQAELDAAHGASSGAHLDLQSALADAETEEEIEAAHAAFADAYVNAYQEAGISPDEIATGAHAEAILRSTTDVSSDEQTSASLLAEVESRRAARVTSAIEAAFEARGEANGEVESAGQELTTSIRGASDAGAEARAEIGEAWQTYSSTVRSEIEGQLDVTAQTALTGLEGTIDTASEAYLSAVATQSTDVSTTVDAVATLRADVVSTTNVEALTTAGVEQASAEGYLGMIFHLEAAGSAAGEF